MQVGGYRPATVADFAVPKQFGSRQTIADTLSIGGIFRALRTIPVVFDIARDMEKHCPSALMMNYVNPMAIISWAMTYMFPHNRYVGLCHSVQDTSQFLARILDENISDIDFTCAGLNHVAFFTKFEKCLPDWTKEDLCPQLSKLAVDGGFPAEEGIRAEVLRLFGYFVTESSIHFSEYTPWFLKRGREDLLRQFQVPLDEYITRCENQIAERHGLRKEILDDTKPLEICRSNEYAAAIIHSYVTGKPSLIYGNVRNNGLIENLPAQAAVEVPCHVDRNGIQPIRIGKIPIQLAAIMRSNVNVQELVVEAIKTKDRSHDYHAAAMDPHTAAELSFAEIEKMVDQLFIAHADFVPSLSEKAA